MRDFEIKVGNKEGELEANKQLYCITKEAYEKSRQNPALMKKNLFYFISYLSNYVENLIMLANYDEALNIIISNIDDIKNANNKAFYNIHAGISIVDSSLKIIINTEYNDKINILWEFVKIAFTNEHLPYSKYIYENCIKCAIDKNIK